MDSIRFYGYVNEEGKANWEIYQSEMDSVDESSSSPLPKIDLQQVHITNGHFVYDDRQQDLYTAIDGFFLHIDGLLTQRGNKLMWRPVLPRSYSVARLILWRIS